MLAEACHGTEFISFFCEGVHNPSDAHTIARGERTIIYSTSDLQGRQCRIKKIDPEESNNNASRMKELRALLPEPRVACETLGLCWCEYMIPLALLPPPSYPPPPPPRLSPTPLIAL